MSGRRKKLPGNRSDFTYVELLQWHFFVNKTRPGGRPDTPGRLIWTVKEIARAVASDDRGVRFWLSGQHLPNSPEPLEKALFGDNTLFDDWRVELSEAYHDAKAERAVRNANRPVGGSAEADNNKGSFAADHGSPDASQNNADDGSASPPPPPEEDVVILKLIPTPKQLGRAFVIPGLMILLAFFVWRSNDYYLPGRAGPDANNPPVPVASPTVAIKEEPAEPRTPTPEPSALAKQPAQNSPGPPDLAPATPPSPVQAEPAESPQPPPILRPGERAAKKSRAAVVQTPDPLPLIVPAKPAKLPPPPPILRPGERAAQNPRAVLVQTPDPLPLIVPAEPAELPPPPPIAPTADQPAPKPQPEPIQTLAPSPALAQTEPPQPAPSQPAAPPPTANAEPRMEPKGAPAAEVDRRRLAPPPPSPAAERNATSEFVFLEPATPTTQTAGQPTARYSAATTLSAAQLKKEAMAKANSDEREALAAFDLSRETSIESQPVKIDKARSIAACALACRRRSMCYDFAFEPPNVDLEGLGNCHILSIFSYPKQRQDGNFVRGKLASKRYYERKSSRSTSQ